MNRSSLQRGGAIFMVFVAVALLAALSYAFLRGSQNNVTMMTDEQARVAADRIIGFGNDVRTGVKRLMLRGCTDQINFANDQYKYRGAPTISAWQQGSFPNTPADFSCNVFHANGAGLSALRFPELANKNGTGGLFAGDSYPAVVQVVGVGTAAPELVWIVMELNPSVCAKINAKLGLGLNDSDGIPNDAFGYVPYGGTNMNYGTFGTVGDNDAALIGKTAFCIHNANSSVFGNYYIVLIPR